MKKSLLATAVAATLPAVATAQVTITGIMDLNVASGTHYGQDYQQVGSSGARTTSLQIIGTEKLSDGLEAKFRIEVQPQIFAGDGNAFNTVPLSPHTGCALGATNLGTCVAGTAVPNGTAQSSGQASQLSGLAGKGYSFVGLAGGFGEVQLGTINSASLAAFSNASGRLGTGIGSGYGQTIGSTSTNTFTRFESSVLYITPTFNGFQGRYLQNFGNDSQFGTSTGVTLRRPEIREFGASYTAGPISVFAAHLTSTSSPNEAAASATAAAASNVKTTTMTLSGAYTAGPLRVGAGLSTIENNAGNNIGLASQKLETSAWMLTGQYQIGAVRLMAHYSERKTDKGPTAFILSSTGATTAGTPVATIGVNEGKKSSFLGLGVEYDLSKRTYLYLRLQDQDMKDGYATTLRVNGLPVAAPGVTATAGTTVDWDPSVRLVGIGVSHQF